MSIATLAFIQAPGMGELLVILVIVLLVFGGSRIPEIAKSLGQGIKEFKKALSGGHDDQDPNSKKS